jgi:hypothetical protein
MKSRAPWLAALTLLVGSGSAFAQIKDVVELLPAETLACLELRQPARLAREVAILVKGSSLEDIPRRLAKKRAENDAERGYSGPYRQQEMLGMLSLFLSPEMLDEAGRTRGGFVALTGFAKDGMPEVVGVLNSSSNFPVLYMRAFLSFARPRLVGEVEGVPLYREMSYVFRAKANAGGAPPQPEWRESGPVMAQLPGLILFGSSVDSLKDVVRRAKGKSSAASLTNLRAFKNAAALRDRPGLCGGSGSEARRIGSAEREPEMDDRDRCLPIAPRREDGSLADVLSDAAKRHPRRPNSLHPQRQER